MNKIINNLLQNINNPFYAENHSLEEQWYIGDINYEGNTNIKYRFERT